MELRAQIGKPGSELGMSQGCSCLLDKEKCLVHGDVDAYVVLFSYQGRRRMARGIHKNSFIRVILRNEVRFFGTLYQAVGASTELYTQGPLESDVYIKEKGEFRDLNDEEREEVVDIIDQLALEIAGI